MASAVILLPFYISLLPTDVYGALSLYLAFALFIQVLVTYSFDSSLYIHFHEFKNDRPTLSSFVSSAFIWMIFSGVLVGLVMSVAGELIFRLVFDDQRISFFPYGLLSVGIGVFQSVFRVYTNFAQSREQPGLYLWSNLLLFTMIAGFTIGGLVLFPGTLIGPVGGRALALAIGGGWVLVRVFREFGITFNYALLKQTFSYNHYTFLYQVQQWSVSYLDRFLMVFFLPLSAIGIYDFSVKCLLGIEFIMTGLNSSFYPKVVSTIMEQPEKQSTVELNRYYHGLTAAILMLISAGILLLPFVIHLIDRKGNYGEAVQYFPYIAIIYVFRSLRLYFGAPYSVLKQARPLAVIYLVVSVIKIGLMIMLMKPYGLYGIIGASLATAALEIVLLWKMMATKFKYRFNVFKLIIAPLVLPVVVLLVEPLWGAQYSWQVHSAYVLLVASFLLWVYRRELRTVLVSKLFRV